MKVFIATYLHRHGCDISVFATAKGAESWRQSLAADYWLDEMPADVALPDNAEAAADAYFNYVEDESFEVEEQEVVQ